MKIFLIFAFVFVRILGSLSQVDAQEKLPGLDTSGVRVSNEEVVQWIYSRRLVQNDYNAVSMFTEEPKLRKFVATAGLDSLILNLVLKGDVDVNKLTHNGTGLSIAQMCAKKYRFSLLVAIAAHTKLNFSTKNQKGRLGLLHRIFLQAPSVGYIKVLTKHLQDKCEIVSPNHQNLETMIESNISLSSEDKKDVSKILKELMEKGLVVEEILPPKAN
ncbi:hypothetical protein Pan241w_08900 [Gimesia alba]|uniref:Ankyrin repeats (3 copies) n=1 Tax=Gimesia alba TaxID=2527973 RepID=A0A517RAF3_9PLAN|nr:hypothetical protein [Gimesia alba]QDT40831.1 hypothetical protein Pan241w_08900 [Gimesia alba]